MDRTKGFTLIELMIVIAIIGILAIIAIPKFIDMVDKAREGSTKGNIGAIRGAIVLYYGDHEGRFPVTLDTATNTYPGYTAKAFVPHYMDEIPQAKLRRNHSNPDSNAVAYGATPTGEIGGWLYNATTGKIYVNSNTTDSKGVYYSTY